ncbi:MAG: hypothetical protein LUH11_02785 [Candidatus Gastranaerophilales bacterium]|nr:hypothetical protein [Candidatus Gastranaerophilales bacterium]
MNLLKEKGIPIENQIRTWHDIVRRPYNRMEADCYTRTRQILMNGIETEAWSFKHCFVRKSHDKELNKLLVNIRRIEDMQQTTVNWLSPVNQTVLDTTLGYEQVAVDLTAWLAQNEPDEYVKETFNFGLLEDFDHLYRYAQFAYMIEETDPNEIVQHMTDVLIGRPTQNHHNDNAIRIRKPYDKDKTSPATKVNILTLISGEQQTHNYYAEHGFMYGNTDLKRLYAEICDVEEEHVTMYETLVDPNETMLEKWLVHEFTEACNYYNCYKDEVDEKLKLIWEEFTQMEIGHLQAAAEMFKKVEKRDPEEVIGTEAVLPCHFETQKEYVSNILENEVDKRLCEDEKYIKIKDIPSSWASYKVQKETAKDGAPSEQAVRLAAKSTGRDIACACEKLLKKQSDLLERGLEKEAQAPNTVSVEKYEKFEKVPPLNFLN